MREQELTLQNQQIALRLSQIQPHFVFNSLTAIRSLIRTDPEQAAATLDDFSMLQSTRPTRTPGPGVREHRVYLPRGGKQSGEYPGGRDCI